jgi:hypothetical protein
VKVKRRGVFSGILQVNKSLVVPLIPSTKKSVVPAVFGIIGVP